MRLRAGCEEIEGKKKELVKRGRKELRMPRFLRMPGKSSSSYLAPFKRSDLSEVTSRLVSLSSTSLHGSCQDQMHVPQHDRPVRSTDENGR